MAFKKKTKPAPKKSEIDHSEWNDAVEACAQMMIQMDNGKQAGEGRACSLRSLKK